MWAWSADLPALIADRAGIEHVYHAHRLGEKRPFELALPPAQLREMVHLDLKKEAVLRRVHGVEVTPALVDAEVRRIEATTRAPEVLAEIKAALGNDPARFARSMARPIVVERILRTRFENDDSLHAAQRAGAESARTAALAAAKDGVAAQHTALRACAGGNVAEATWELIPRTETERAAEPAPALPAVPVKATAQSASYSVEATVQRAQTLVAPEKNAGQKLYFEDLPPELQNVLRVQLQKPTDVSAVIETPTAFLLFLAKEKTAALLRVGRLNLPKRSYEAWLAEQPD